ncbi:MAG: GNAT family N-acetyltransferase [Verrucomicrobiota bacterium]
MCELIRAELSNPVHAEAIMYLLNAYATDIMGGGQELSVYTKTHLIEALRARSNCHVILAYVGGKAAGISINFEAFSTFACRPIMNIHDFAVAPEFRGQGVARALLEKVEEVAKELGCDKLTLEVLEGNRRAQSVYKQFGFAGYELDPAMGRAMFYEKKLEAV